MSSGGPLFRRAGIDPVVSFAAIIDWHDEGASIAATAEHFRRIGVEVVTVLDRRLAGRAGGPAGIQGNGHHWVIAVAKPLGDEDIDRLRLALGAASAADWVLFAEEGDRWLPASGTLHGLAGLDEAEMLDVPRYMVMLGPDGPAMADQPTPEEYASAFVWSQPFADITAHLDESPTAAWTEGRLIPGRMVRPSVLTRELGAPARPEAAVAPERRVFARDVVVAHSPYRTFEQFARSAGRTFAAMAGARSTAPDGIGTHEDWERQVHTTTSLGRLKSRQAVRSVAAVLSQPIPSFPSEDAYLAAISASEPWLSLAAGICVAEGVGEVGRSSTWPPSTARL